MSLLEHPMHPGEVLDALYLGPLGLGAIALARAIGVPRTRIERLVKRTTGVSPDTALRLARALETTPEYWIAMQTNYDLAVARRSVDLSGIVPVRQAVG